MFEAHSVMTLSVIIGLFFVFCVYNDLYIDSFMMGVICIVVIWFAWRISIPDTPEEVATKQAAFLKKEEEAKLKEIPREMSKSNGCTVYVFERKNREHFFTRCEKETITETTWSENCGKSCIRQKSDVISTPTLKK